jgi:hypothetical protein
MAAPRCAPERMVRIVTSEITPGIPPGAFALKPKTIYRQGNRYMRTEEELDSALGLHLLMIVSEPDIWFVNRVDKTGKHIVDPGPTFDVGAPIVGLEGAPPDFVALEFGCEADFVRKSAARTDGHRSIQGRAYSVHVLQEGGQRLEVLLDARGAPGEIGFYRDGKPLLVIRYDSYQRDLPLDPGLFARPEGFAYTEERPGAAPAPVEGRPAT